MPKAENELMRTPLSAKSIRQHLRDQIHDQGQGQDKNKAGLDGISKVHVFSSVSSTNDYLLEYPLQDEQFAVCVAEQQMQGRGRYGHQWVSPASANLYLSMLWPLRNFSERPRESNKVDSHNNGSNGLEALSLWLLIAIANLLEQLGCEGIQLKWPNDLCVQNKKLAGVLLERKMSPTRNHSAKNNPAGNNIVIGIGLNVAMSSTEGDAIETPWIDLLSVQPDWQLSRNELAAKVITVFYETLQKLEANQLKELGARWKVYDMLYDKPVKFLRDGSMKSGHVKGLDDAGLIVMDIDGKPEHLHSAHISEIKIIGNEK